MPNGRSYVALVPDFPLVSVVAPKAPFAVNPYAFYEDMLKTYPKALCKPAPRKADAAGWDAVMRQVANGKLVDDPAFYIGI